VLALARHEWTLLISFPDKAEPSVSQANGSRGDVIATAHKRIDGWMTRQRRKARLPPINLTLPTLVNDPRFLPQRSDAGG